MKADVSTLRSDVSQLKSDVSDLKTGMSALRVDMAKMEGRLSAQVNRQAWTRMSVMATLMVASVGVTGYFVKILA